MWGLKLRTRTKVWVATNEGWVLGCRQLVQAGIPVGLGTYFGSICRPADPRVHQADQHGNSEASCAQRILAPDVQGAVHPPTALVCWQVRGARRAPMAAILRKHPCGARHAPPARPVDEPGAAHTTHPPHAQPPHRRPHSIPTGCSLWMAGATIGRCTGSCSSWPSSGSAQQQRGSGRAARHTHASVCADARRGSRPRSGRLLVVEPAHPSRLAGPPGPTAEPGGLRTARVSAREYV